MPRLDDSLKQFKYWWEDHVRQPMSRLEEAVNTPGGKGTLIGGIILAGIVVLYCISSLLFSESEAAKLSRNRTFICSETGDVFEYELEVGLKLPVRSPYSGKETGYIAEACYWTREGKIKDDPTWVLLNEAIRKPGPTFCPDCGRLVVGHNPYPQPGDSPPPLPGELVAGEPQR